MPVIRDVLAAFGIAVVGADGYEADDVIGTLSQDAGMPVDVVTGDRDLFQLVDDDHEVRILYIARGVGKHERVTNSVVQEKYGIDGRQYADFAALRGDASDGLPGVDRDRREDRGDPAAAVRRPARAARGGGRPGLQHRAEPAPQDHRGGRLPGGGRARHPVARDIDLGKPELLLPLTPVDPEALVALSEKWNLESPIARLVESLTNLRLTRASGWVDPGLRLG